MRKIGDILALDPSTHMGYCRGLPGGPLEYGTKLIQTHRHQSRAEVLDNLIKWLAPILMNNPPDYLVFEAPLPPNKLFGATSADVFRMLHGIAGHIESLGFHYGVKPEEATVSEIRCWALGSNMKSKRAKKAVVKLSEAWGFHPQDDNAADAIMVHSYFTAKHWPELGRLSQLKMFHEDVSPSSTQSGVNDLPIADGQNQEA